MRYLSVCSGIEAASAAWLCLGWQAVAFSEIDPFPCAVLAHHYPDVPNWGDMTKYKEWPDANVDLLCGGTPCQSFSVAGLRKGLDDPRGDLMLTFGAIADKYRPRWLVWENVPGVLSSNGGRDFGTFLGMLGQLGYGFAYRVLDAQYFGVPQRRRRVFVVGYLGDWRRAAAVLFERHSLQGHPSPSREAGENIAPTLDVRAGRSGETTFHTSGGLIPEAVYSIQAGATRTNPRSGPGGVGVQRDLAYTLEARREVQCVAFSSKDYGGDASVNLSPTLRAMGHAGSHANAGGQVAVAWALGSHAGAADGEATNKSHASGGPVGSNISEELAYSLRAGRQQCVAVAIRTANTGANGHGISPELAHTLDQAQGQAVCVTGNITHTLRADGFDAGEDGTGRGQPIIAFDTTQVTSKANRSNPKPGDPCHPLAAGAHAPAITLQMAVRRLTPRECERLQGFPDGWTDVPYRNRPAADGPRYKALGNSWAVPVARWIGERIQKVEEI